LKIYTQSRRKLQLSYATFDLPVTFKGVLNPNFRPFSFELKRS